MNEACDPNSPEKKIYSALSAIRNKVNELTEISKTSYLSLEKLDKLNSKLDPPLNQDKGEIPLDFDSGTIMDKIDVIHNEIHLLLMEQRDFVEDIRHIV